VLFLVLSGLALLRVWAVLWGEVGGANAYYRLCAGLPAPAYFDGPAGTAMLVRVFSGMGDAWLLLGPLWAVAATLALVHFGSRVADPRGAAGAAVVMNVLPAFNAEALVAGPVLPALTFSLLGASFVWDASRGQSPRIFSWFAAGTAFAGGALFAYWAALFGLAAGLVPLARPSGRRMENFAGLAWIVIALAGVLRAPWIWNAEREFIPVAGWTLRGLIQPDWPALGAGLVDFLAGISPVIAITACVVFVRVVAGCRGAGPAGFVAAVAAPGVLLGGLAVYRGWDAGIAALPAVALVLPSAWVALERGRAILWAGAALAVAFSVPVYTGIVRGNGLMAETAAHVLALDDSLSGEIPGGLFHIAGDAGLAASLGYQIRNAIVPPEGHPPVYELESQAITSQFAYWPSYADFVEAVRPSDEFFTESKAGNPFEGHSAVYVGREGPAGLPQAVKGAFSDVQIVREAGPPEDRLYIYLCLDYQTMPL